MLAAPRPPTHQLHGCGFQLMSFIIRSGLWVTALGGGSSRRGFCGGGSCFSPSLPFTLDGLIKPFLRGIWFSLSSCVLPSWVPCQMLDPKQEVAESR